MAISVNTNVGALNALASATSTSQALEKSMERLASGKRINSASDDAAGLAIASRLTSELKGTNQAIRNAGDAQSLIDTAEGAHGEISNMLQRMRELAVQAANDTNSTSDRASIQSEIDALVTEIDRIAQTSSWGTEKLLNGTAGSTLATSTSDKSSFNFQVGSSGAGANVITTEISAMTSAALGLTGASVAANALDTTGPGRMTIDGGKISIEGTLVSGDVFNVDVNDVLVSMTYSTTDEYSNDLAGAAAQMKDVIDALSGTAGTNLSNMVTVDNKDGSLTLSESVKPEISLVKKSLTASTVAYDATASTLTIGGTFTAGDIVTASINGTVTSYTNAVTDGFALATPAGAASGLARAIRDSIALDNIIVSDDSNGTLTITQTTAPVIESAQVALAAVQESVVAYDDVSVISITGSFVADKTFSMKVYGQEVSIDTSTSDSFADTKAGVASQLATAINNAGVHGITAVKGTGDTVDLVSKVEAKDGVTLSSTSTNNYIFTTTGFNAAATINISGDQTVVAAAGAYDTGDAYSFNVGGKDFTLTVGADGYEDDIDGITAQMVDMLKAGLGAHYAVAEAKSTAAGVSVTRALTGVTGGGTNSTVVTDTLVRDKVATTTNSSTTDLSVTSTANSTATIAKLDAALLTVNSQRSDLGAVSNRLDSTISNLTNVATNVASSRGRIEDADFASESTNLAKQQILSQAATAMLAQANAAKQGVLQLLQG
jgi:flagellin